MNEKPDRELDRELDIEHVETTVTPLLMPLSGKYRDVLPPTDEFIRDRREEEEQRSS